MKRTITLQFILIVIITVISTLALAIMAFYRSFTDEIRDDLKSYAGVVMSAGVFASDKIISADNMRVTMTDSAGVVIYDTDSATGRDFSGRTEIKEAMDKGEGFSVSHIKHDNKNMFYYTKQLENGNILRVGKRTDSRLNMIYNSIPQIVFIILFMAAASSVLAYFLTKTLIKPLEGMAEDINAGKEVNVYKELEPFAEMIKQQHEDILKNANMRQEFTANVSHELKTPLTSIKGFSETLRIVDDENTKNKFLDIIDKETDRLTLLIDDILILSNIENMNKLSNEKFNPNEVVEDVINMVKKEAAKKNISIEAEKKFKGLLVGDKNKFYQVVLNLVTNGIKYSNENGNVKIFTNKSKNKFVLMVKDDGIGIPKEDLPRIFERFYTVDKSRTSKSTGLGLAIVKHIVKLFNGEIFVESEVGKGRKFTVVSKNVYCE